MGNWVAGGLCELQVRNSSNPLLGANAWKSQTLYSAVVPLLDFELGILHLAIVF